MGAGREEVNEMKRMMDRILRRFGKRLIEKVDKDHQHIGWGVADNDKWGCPGAVENAIPRYIVERR